MSRFPPTSGPLAQVPPGVRTCALVRRFGSGVEVLIALSARAAASSSPTTSPELGTPPRGGWGQLTDPAVPSLASAPSPASTTPVEWPGTTRRDPDAGLGNGHIANCIAGCLYLLDDGLLGGLPRS